MIKNINNMDPIADVSKVANRKRIGDDVEKLREKVSRETSKIIKLRVAQDTAYWDLKEKLQAVEANHERLQANMVDVQMQHEAISANYEAELRRRPETLNKLAASRAIADTLEENAARLRDSLRRQAADCAALQNAYGGAAQRAVLAVAGAQGAVRAQRACFEGAIERERVAAERARAEATRAAAAAASYCQQAESARRDAATAAHDLKMLRETLHTAQADLDRTTARCTILAEENEHLKSRGDNAVRLLNEAETERQRLTAELQSTRDQLERGDVELERVRGEVARLEAELRAEGARWEAELEGERSARAQAVVELEGERSVRAQAVAEFERERSARARAEAELEVERSGRAKAVAEFEVERSGRAKAGAELEEERSARARADAVLERERSARRSAEAEWRAATDRAESEWRVERERLERAVRAARDELARLEAEAGGERVRLEAEVRAARDDLARLEAEAGGERARLEAERTEAKCRADRAEREGRDRLEVARIAAEERAAHLLAQLEEERARGRDAAAALAARADTISDLMRNVSREAEERARIEATLKARDTTLRKKEADLLDRMNIINELRAEKERLQKKINVMQGTIDNIQMELARDVQTPRATPAQPPAVREPPERDAGDNESLDFSFLMSDSSGESMTLDIGKVNRKVRSHRERAQQVRAERRSDTGNVSGATNRTGATNRPGTVNSSGTTNSSSAANRSGTVNSSGTTNNSSAANRSGTVNSSGTTNRYFFKTKRLDAKRK